MNDLHTPLFCSFEIDRGIPSSRRGDHTKLGQALDDSTRHRRALPHHANDLEWLQALDNGVGVREMVIKYGDGRPPIPHRPVREGKSAVLVVVQHGDSDVLLLGRLSDLLCHWIDFARFVFIAASGEMSSARYQAHWAASQ